MNVGNLDDLPPEDGRSKDMKTINKKRLVQEKKKELERQIFDLRMRCNSLLKSEYESKMSKL